MNEWFENETFWIETYPFMFYEERLSATDEQCDKVLRLVHPRGATVLDLCCGPGRFSVALAKRGYAVTGVDLSNFLLEKAKARAKQENVEVEWVHQDMRGFVRRDSFDLVLSMFTSFGYFDNRKDDLKVLANILRSLKPGGAFLIDVAGKERWARTFQPTISEVLPDGAMLVQRNEVIDDWTRTRNTWVVIRDGKAKTFQFHLNVYSGQELRDRLEQVGFGDVKLHGDLDGNEYGLDARRLIAVGIKPLATFGS